MTARPLESYSPTYLRNKTNILAYQAAHKEKIKEYMREYMRDYRKRKGVAETQDLRVYIRAYLIGRFNGHKGPRILGITRKEWATKMNMGERAFKGYVRARVVDHIVPIAYLQENHPDCVEFFSRWYNIQFVTTRQNSRKGAWVDANDSKVQEIIKLMQAERDIQNN